MKIRLLLFLILLSGFTGLALAQYEVPLYWEPSISRALISRDEYFKNAGIPASPINFDFLNDKKSLLFLEERLSYISDAGNPWYHFLLAVLYSKNDSLRAYKSFNDALSVMQGSPGMAWILFIESRRSKHFDWAEECLTNLEVLFLTEGAESAPIISQQLLAAAREEKKSGNTENALRYCEWSQRFDRTGAWQNLAKAVFAGPLRPQQFFASIYNLGISIFNSWRIQAAMLFLFFRWLHTALIIFIAVIFITTSFKALPPLFTSLFALYPHGVPCNYRYVFSSIIFVSLAFTGLIPFILIAGFLYWRHLDDQDRSFLAIAVGLSVIAAVCLSTSDTIMKIVSRDSSVSMFCQASSEGYTQEMESKLRARLAEYPDDYIARTALANLLRKSFDIKLSLAHMAAARRVREDDPVVLVTSGNICYTAGNTDLAEKFYLAAMESRSSCPEAYWNYMACKKKQGIKTDEPALKTSLTNTVRITEFAKRNERCFSENEPVLRQVIQPDYPVSFFWLNIFPEQTAIVQKISTAHIFLIRRLPSMLAAAAALAFIFTALILARRFVLKNGETRKKETGPMRIVMRDALYMRKQKRYLIYIPAFFDIVFPGSGSLIRTSRGVGSSSVLIAVSACSYATYWTCMHCSFEYPFWLAGIPAVFITGIFALYNLVMAARAIVFMTRELRG